MRLALNAWTFAADTPLPARLAATAAAGFDGIELTVDADGPLTSDCAPARLREIAAQAEALGLEIVALASGLFWQTNYAAPKPQRRQQALALTRRLLEMAAELGAGAVLVIPAVVGRWDQQRPTTGYADALYRVLDALLELRHDAERLGVDLALENVWNRFLLSPLELAELIDRVNSPRVGCYLDVGNVMPLGYPEDWIATLGGRVRRVHVKDYCLVRPGPAGFCPLGEGSVNWPAVVSALTRVGYDGPLTYEGPGEPQEIITRMRRILSAADRENAP